MKTYWEKCSGPKSRREPGPKVCISLNHAGDITLNAAAFYAMGNPTDVWIFYDAANSRIGIRKCSWEDPDAFHRYMRKNKLFPRVLRARRFLKQFGVRVTETVRFLPPKQEKDRIWILDLKTAYVPDQVKKHWRNVKTNAESQA